MKPRISNLIPQRQLTCKITALENKTNDIKNLAQQFCSQE